MSGTDVARSGLLFTTEKHQGWVRVRFFDRPGLGATRLDAVTELRSLCEEELAAPGHAAVVLAFPVRSLGSKLLSAVHKAESELAEHCGDGPLLPLVREENAILELIRHVRALPSLVLCTLGGDIDLAFLGPALACDYRIAAEDARFVNQWLRGGEPPLGAAVWFLAEHLGLGRASTLLLDTSVLAAQDALALGLVQKCVPAHRLDEAAAATAERFAQLPKGSVAAMKRELVAATGSLERFLELEAREVQVALWRNVAE